MSQNQAQNLFDRYSSKVKRINIELPNYKYFHSPSREDIVDERFIGREGIIQRFKNILTNSETKTGAYLVTGYRGMGKSSFVSKVLHEISFSKKFHWFKLLIVTCLWFFIYLINYYLLCYINNDGLSFFFLSKDLIKKIGNSGFIQILYNNIFYLYWVSIFYLIFSELKKRTKFNKKGLKFIFSKKKSIDRNKRIILRLNLGHEVLNEIDILSLIANSIEKEFISFAYNIRKQFLFYFTKYSILLCLTLFVGISFSDIKTQLRETVNTEYYFPSQSEKYSKEYISINSYKESISNEKTPRPKFISFINIFDIYLNSSCHFFSTFINQTVLGRNIFPNQLNYFQILIFILLYLSVALVSRFVLNSNYTDRTSRHGIKKLLKKLNENIDSILLMETNIGNNISSNGIGTFINKKTSKEYPQAGIRQIEKSLIDLFNQIGNLTWPIKKPEFIIVFDELDKIDPKNNINLNDKENEVPGFESSTSGFTGGATTRHRKQNVLRLMANMKYFITTANAKFIFIAGRELYDAFLADVSDREFAISSIFHEVFYVESFLSDSSDQNMKDITSMTERYICQFLLPESFKIENGEKRSINDFTLKKYNDYLIENDDTSRIQNNGLESTIEAKQKREKALMLLYQFTHYLTHVSNGAPKKITNFFEKYVISKEQLETKDSFTVGANENKGKFYLSFGYNDQCKIGFIHYLSNPIMLAIINNVCNYGDKLLVSASFLIDHIFKFHRNGFSWRNLEHAPEILEINRTPELRNFIKSIINYLSQTHLSPVMSGLYIYKFPKKISEEISFISKTSEEASAIFNFTLDESLAVKQHYIKMLDYLTKRHQAKSELNLNNEKFIHSISGVHHILGDLYLLDEEYTEAIFEYQDCIQSISKNFDDKYNPHSISHLLLLVRTMLKLGLAFEKRKTFNSAYSTYSELTSLLIDFRYINEKKLGLQYKTIQQNDWMNQKAVLYRKKKKERREKDPFYIETRPKNLNVEKENKNIIFSAIGENTIPQLTKPTTRLKNKIISRLSLFDDIRLMYQPLIAKLFVLEKTQLGGISRMNIEIIEGEFLNLHLATNIKEKFLVSADFFKRVGDIMFYKNGIINKDSCTLFNGLDFWGYDINNDIDTFCVDAQQDVTINNDLKKIKDSNFDTNRVKKDSSKTFLENIIRQQFKKDYETVPYFKKYSKTDLFFVKSFRPPNELKTEILNKVLSCNKRRTCLLNKGFSIPCYACKYFNITIKILAENLFKGENDSRISKSLIFLKALDTENLFYSQRNDYMQTLASVLGGFGDVLVSCSFEEDNIESNFLEAFFKYIKKTEINTDRFEIFSFEINTINKERNDENEIQTVIGLSNLEKAILYYLASAKYYRRSSHIKEAHIMYKKIIQLILEYTYNSETASHIQDYISQIQKELVSRTIQTMFAAYDQIHVAEIQKLKWNKSLELYELLNLNNLSIFPDLEEIICTYYELELECIPTNSEDSNIKKILDSNIFSPYRLNNSIYNRLVSLRFKSIVNKKLFTDLIPKYDFDITPFSPDHPTTFYSLILEKLNRIEYFKESTDSNTFELLEHLIVDSIFSLQKFIEIVSPQNKTTLFTNSYVAKIYEDLFVWTQLFDFLFMLYAYRDDIYRIDDLEKKTKIEEKIVGHIKARRIVKGDNKEYKQEDLKKILNTINIDKHINAELFFNKLYKSIDKSGTHFINSNYMAEMAIKLYRDAYLIHTEGKPYKNMIEDMHFLDDDLDNNSLKFYLALERYRINSGKIDKSINNLKGVYSNSTLFEVENYL